MHCPPFVPLAVLPLCRGCCSYRCYAWTEHSMVDPSYIPKGFLQCKVLTSTLHVRWKPREDILDPASGGAPKDDGVRGCPSGKSTTRGWHDDQNRPNDIVEHCRLPRGGMHWVRWPRIVGDEFRVHGRSSRQLAPSFANGGKRKHQIEAEKHTRRKEKSKFFPTGASMSLIAANHRMRARLPRMESLSINEFV